MNFFLQLKTRLKNTVSPPAINTAKGAVFVQAPQMPAYKSAYRLSLEEKGLKIPTENRRLTDEEMTKLVDFFVFQTPKNKEADRDKIIAVLHLINQKSPTGRIILKQLPPGLIFNTRKTKKTASGWVFPGQKTVFLNKNSLQEESIQTLAGIVIHECGHVLEYNQLMSLDPRVFGYFAYLNNQPLAAPLDEELEPVHAFVLRKLFEAEKMAIEKQVETEISGLGNILIRWITAVPLCVGKILIPPKNCKVTHSQKSMHVSSVDGLLQDVAPLIPALRYHFFKFFFSLKYKEMDSFACTMSTIEKSNFKQDYIQRKAAKKAISSTIKNAMHFAPVRNAAHILTGGEIALGGVSLLTCLSSVSTTMPSCVLSLLYMTSMPFMMTVLGYKKELGAWNSYYNSDSFQVVFPKIKEDSFEKSSFYFENILSSFEDKYDYFLKRTDISGKTINDYPLYRRYFDLTEKTAGLKAQTARELLAFAQIKSHFKNEQSTRMQEFEVMEAIYKAAEQQFQKTQSESLDEHIRRQICFEFLNKEISVDAMDEQKNTMLHITRDPQLILLLLNKGANLAVQNKYQYTPQQCLAHHFVQDNELFSALQKQLNIQNMQQMVCLLHLLSDCYKQKNKEDFNKNKQISTEMTPWKKGKKRGFSPARHVILER